MEPKMSMHARLKKLRENDPDFLRKKEEHDKALEQALKASKEQTKYKIEHLKKSIDEQWKGNTFIKKEIERLKKEYNTLLLEQEDDFELKRLENLSQFLAIENNILYEKSCYIEQEFYIKNILKK